MTNGAAFQVPGRRQLIVGLLVLALVLVVVYLTWVSTTWGHSLDNDAYFRARESARLVVEADKELLDKIRRPTLGLALAVMIVVGLVRRAVSVGLIAVVGVTVAVAGAEILKGTLPWTDLVPSDAALGARLQAESYPSGHSTIATSVALAAVMLVPVAWRAWSGVVAGLATATVATSVVIAGWHRPSDALGGVCWAGLVMGIAALVAFKVRGPQSEPQNRKHNGAALVGSLIAAVAFYVALWILAARTSFDYPDANFSFLSTMAAIVIAAVSVTAWFADSLRNAAWQAPSNVQPHEGLQPLENA